MKNKFYLAGKITDTSRLGKMFPKLKTLREKKNLLRFYEWTKFLRGLGLDVYNPVENEVPQSANFTWEQYLAEDIIEMKKHNCTDILLMDGWANSLGARLERAVAKKWKLVIHNEP